MVRVTRLHQDQSTTEFGTNITQQSTNDSSNFIHAKKQRSIHRRRRISQPFKNQQSNMIYPRRKLSIGGLGKNLSYQFKDNNRRLEDVQRESISNPIGLELPLNENSNQTSQETFGTETQHQSKKTEVWSKCLLFWLTVPIILSLVAIVTVAVMIISQPVSDIPGHNWVINGDGETGPCESGAGVTSPTSWNHNGSITQIYYSNPFGDVNATDPGPSNRGHCYFYGQLTNYSTSMWQTATISNLINPIFIDNQKISFNLSAWLGGYYNQDDNARVSLTFTNQNNQQTGDTITLGPVLAADRGNLSSLIFRQTNGLVPIGARSFTITVTITCVFPTTADGASDNIALVFYR